MKLHVIILFLHGDCLYSDIQSVYKNAPTIIEISLWEMIRSIFAVNHEVLGGVFGFLMG